MKSAMILAAIGAATAVAGSASAGIVEVINIGNLTLAGNQSITIPYQADPGNTSAVIGFTVELDFDDSNDPFAWASDLKLDFNGWGYSVGGYTSMVNPWDFQDSDPAGHYFHDGIGDLDGLAKSDLTGFTFTNDFSFNFAVSWNNVVITLYKVPAPGALALFGLVGLAGSRRRR